MAKHTYLFFPFIFCFVASSFTNCSTILAELLPFFSAKDFSNSMTSCDSVNDVFIFAIWYNYGMNVVSLHKDNEIMARKPISKKTRFEIFKRDCFKCQYCGKSAPDVILHVDHINPVANGGDNEMLNLITSCFDCNSGKSDRKLSDNSVVEIQRKQIEELQERRNQLDMMLEWKTSLVKESDDDYLKVVAYLHKVLNYELNEKGLDYMKGVVKKYGALASIKAINESVEKYLNAPDNDSNIEYVINKIKTVAKLNNLTPEERDQSERVANVLRIARSKFYTFEYTSAAKAVSRFMNVHKDVARLEEITDESEKFSEWKNALYYA